MKTLLLLCLTLGISAYSAHAQTPLFEVEDSGGTVLFQVNADGSLQLPTGATNGHVLTTNGAGNATWQAPSGGGGLGLPFDGTWDQISPAFKITKTAAGETVDLRNTAGSRLIYGVLSNGVPGSVAVQFNSTHNGILVNAGNGASFSGLNNSASPTIRAVNNGAGLAGEFLGGMEVTSDLEVGGDLTLTGDLDCTACVRGSDVGTETLTGDHIDDGTLTTDDIEDGTLVSEDIANGTIRSIDIQNGTLTATDVSDASTSGIFVSKEQVTGMSATFNVPAGGTASGQATCGDNNYLPLQGTCSIPGGEAAFLMSGQAFGWGQTDVPATYECTYFNSTSSTVTAQVSMLCVSN